MKSVIRHTSKVVLVGFLTVMLSLAEVGCSAKQWFDIVSALLPIIGQTYLQFYGFAQHSAPDAADTALVQRLSSSGQDAIHQVELIMDSAKTGAIGGVAQATAILTQLQQSTDAFLNDAQVKNSARFAQLSDFAHALLADITDVVALIPAFAQSAGGKFGGAQRAVSYSKAKSLHAVFQERLDKLPKS